MPRFRKRRSRSTVASSATPEAAGAALAVQGAAWTVAAMAERNRYWRAGAVASGAISLAAAVAVWTVRDARRLKWVAVTAFATGLPIWARLSMTSGGRRRGGGNRARQRRPFSDRAM